MKTLTDTVVRGALFVVLAGAFAGVACSDSKTSPDPADPKGSSCRTYPTAATVSTVALGFTQTTTLGGAFNTSTKQSTITTRLPAGTLCTTSVSSYPSVADFVDEVKVVPPLSLQTSTTTTNGAGCGSGVSTAALSYDSQKRLVSLTSAGSVTTYTAWDSSGRPTIGSFPGTSIVNAYDDVARTLTQTQTTGPITSVSTTTYDLNGTNVKVVNSTAGITTTTTFTIAATDKVCK